MTANLMRAISIAMNAHKGQMDKSGEPYIYHALTVMMLGETEQERIVGALHDVVEDSVDWTLRRLSLSFSDEIVDAVDAMTRRDGEPYLDFIKRAKANPIAREVKLNDIVSNLDPDRLRLLEPETRSRLKAKYLAAKQELERDG